MGFDMRLVQEPAEYPPGYEPQDPDEPASYRFVIGSIGICLAVMAAAEVVNYEQEPPEFPDWPPPRMSENRRRQIERYMQDPDRLRERLTPDEWGLYEAYQRELEKVTAVGPANPGKVPEFKFLSNDGWLVCPAECLAIAVGLDRLLRDGHPPLFEWLEREQGYSAEGARAFIRLWAGYNRVAVGCGGYRVW
jgi:hypothetical protein